MIFFSSLLDPIIISIIVWKEIYGNIFDINMLDGDDDDDWKRLKIIIISSVDRIVRSPHATIYLRKRYLFWFTMNLVGIYIGGAQMRQENKQNGHKTKQNGIFT